MENKKIAVIIPTYNEKSNIIPLVKKILSLPLNIKVIVVDDNSPDKTGEIVKECFKNNTLVDVYIRREKRGRGLAGIFGYKRAIEGGFEIIGEMDGDMSHNPKFIPAMIMNLKNSDAVIGSRYLKKGGEERKSFIRKLISRFASFYLRMILNINLTDPTSGFRFFKKEYLAKIINYLKAEDPFIVTEVIFYLNKAKAKISEVPIVFYERKTGKSKLKFTTLLKYLFRVIYLRIYG